MIDTSKIQFEKMGGLVPAVIQNNLDGTVLMLGFMNREALDLTLSTKKVTFYSRSKQRLWQKGETSGNFLNLVEIFVDCDEDSLLVLVRPEGPTCHLDRNSCFDIEFQPFLSKLFTLIESRKKELPMGSYTTSLFQGGLPLMLQKVNEESVEVQHAARKETQQRLVEESADLLYHLMVLLSFKGVSLEDVTAILRERNGGDIMGR